MKKIDFLKKLPVNISGTIDFQNNPSREPKIHWQILVNIFHNLNGLQERCVQFTHLFQHTEGTEMCLLNTWIDWWNVVWRGMNFQLSQFEKLYFLMLKALPQSVCFCHQTLDITPTTLTSPWLHLAALTLTHIIMISCQTGTFCHVNSCPHKLSY